MCNFVDENYKEFNIFAFSNHRDSLERKKKLWYSLLTKFIRIGNKKSGIFYWKFSSLVKCLLGKAEHVIKSMIIKRKYAFRFSQVIVRFFYFLY